MEGKVVLGFLALVACANAASISGMAGFNPNQIFAGGQITLPSIPGINVPFFGNSMSNDNTNGTANSTNHSNSTGSPFGPFTSFINLIPGINFLLPQNSSNNLSGFPNIDELISRIPGFNGNRTGNATFVIPEFPSLPGLNQGPYIPGLSEALAHARHHLQAALNITADFSTGMRDAIQVALNSDHPADSIRIMLDTIAKVYGTVAVNCPFIFVGSRILGEGIRLSGEVMKSIANVTIGSAADFNAHIRTP